MGNMLCVCVCVCVCAHSSVGMTSPAAAALLCYLTDNWDHMSVLALSRCVKSLQEWCHWVSIFKYVWHSIKSFLVCSTLEHTRNCSTYLGPVAIINGNYYHMVCMGFQYYYRCQWGQAFRPVCPYFGEQDISKAWLGHWPRKKCLFFGANPYPGVKQEIVESRKIFALNNRGNKTSMFSLLFCPVTYPVLQIQNKHISTTHPCLCSIRGSKYGD